MATERLSGFGQLKKISRGVLQKIASALIGQNTQEQVGESELHDGIRALEEAREKRCPPGYRKR